MYWYGNFGNQCVHSYIWSVALFLRIVNANKVEEANMMMTLYPWFAILNDRTSIICTKIYRFNANRCVFYDGNASFKLKY